LAEDREFTYDRFKPVLMKFNILFENFKKIRMTYQDFTLAFTRQVAALSYEQGLRLELGITKELLPDYQRFFELHTWGDPGVLAEGISLAESSITNNIDPRIAEALANKVYDVMPDTEDFGDFDGSCALNAAACAVALLSYIIDKDPKHLHAIGTLYCDTIYFRLKGMGVEAESDIENHPLMQAAWEKLLDFSE
jgi:Protein of unknown function (DUF416)